MSNSKRRVARDLAALREQRDEDIDLSDENGGAKIDHRAAILSRVRAAQN